MKLVKIKSAIISVNNKKNLSSLLPTLKKFNIKIISSGGTFKKIKKMKYKCNEISNYTKFNEMLDGRVKTLHPYIHAGILNIRNNKKHQNEIRKEKIFSIDLVIVDLYPFEKQLHKKINLNNHIEYIDIGGPALIRSAAKNFNFVTVISDISDYKHVAN